ncbi:hypothetical protein [Ornithinimicrobium humiphilum]|nr:hypothetical protein [Ornithinimicrobium humiphilum]
MNATAPTTITSATDVQGVTNDEQASVPLRKMDGEFVELTGRNGSGSRSAGIESARIVSLGYTPAIHIDTCRHTVR